MNFSFFRLLPEICSPCPFNTAQRQLDKRTALENLVLQSIRKGKRLLRNNYQITSSTIVRHTATIIVIQRPTNILGGGALIMRTYSTLQALPHSLQPCSQIFTFNISSKLPLPTKSKPIQHRCEHHCAEHCLGVPFTPLVTLLLRIWRAGSASAAAPRHGKKEVRLAGC